MTNTKITRLKLNAPRGENDREEKLEVFILKNDYLSVTFSQKGCQILGIYAPDRNGARNNVVLQKKDIFSNEPDSGYIGCVVGRVANRIGGGRFVLNGKEYNVAKNNGENHLHGGIEGFDRKIFTPKIIENGVELEYVSKDMEEGYPGELTLKVRYILNGRRFRIEYEAVSSEDTVCNFTNHMYFNLTGDTDKDILDHELTIAASSYMPIDEGCLPLGEKAPLEGTCLDFQAAKTIRSAVEADDEQVRRANGIDHAYCLNASDDVILLYEKKSGRMIRISTDLPMAHIYTGNYLPDAAEGMGGHFIKHAGVAIETELMPNSINLEEDSPTILRKGTRFKSYTEYGFITI